MEPHGKKRVSLWEIFRTFLLIGTTGFGGGMAIVALVERTCVHDKQWVTHEEFMHGIAFGQILGPFSLNSCTFIGCYLRGANGGVVASAAFILPSFLLISVLSWLYFKFHELPELHSALKGTNPVIIGLILVAVISMAKKSRKGTSFWVMAVAAFAATTLLGMNALYVLILAALWAFGRSLYEREHA